MLLDGAQVSEVVERGPRVGTLGVEPGQLRHDDERHLTLERQRFQPLQHQGQILVLRRSRHARGRRHELQVVDHHEAQRRQRLEPPGDGLEVRRRKGQARERKVAQPHRRAADAGARLVVELGAAQLVHGHPPLDRERALHEPLLVHLPREQGHAGAALRHAQRQPQRERRLAGADVASQHHEVAASQPAPHKAVDRREAGGNRIARHLARTLLIHPLDEGLGRMGGGLGRALREPTTRHHSLLCVYPSIRLPV